MSAPWQRASSVATQKVWLLSSLQVGTVPVLRAAVFAGIIGSFLAPRWFGLLTLAGATLCWVFSGWASRSWLVASPARAPALLLLLVLPASALPIGDWTAALPRYCALIGGVGLTLVTPGFLSDWSEERVARLIWAAAIVGLVGFMLGGLMFVDWPTHKLSVLTPIYQRLPASFLGPPFGSIHPNQAAGVLILCIPVVAIGMAPAVSGWFGRFAQPVSLALAALGTVTVALTLSRSAIIGLLVAGGAASTVRILQLPASRRRRNLPFVVSGVVSGALLAGLLTAGWFDQRGTPLETGPGRLALWSRSLALIVALPLTGVGPGQVPLVFERVIPTTLTQQFSSIPHAHNLLLHTALETGVPSAAVAVLALVRLGWALLARAQHQPGTPSAAVSLGLLGALVAFVTYGITDSISLSARGSVVFWLTVAGAAAWTCYAGTNSQLGELRRE